MPDPVPSMSCDVTVIGGGLSGKAASLHLARAGLKVICIEPPSTHSAAGGRVAGLVSSGSFDRLGLSPDSLVASTDCNLENGMSP